MKPIVGLPYDTMKAFAADLVRLTLSKLAHRLGPSQGGPNDREKDDASLRPVADSRRVSLPYDTMKAFAAELVRLADHAEQAEFHAHSVRQLIGQRDRLMRALELVEHGSATLESRAIGDIIKSIRLTPSQFYQDVYCLILNGVKRDGFFVEFGACDGKLISNTFLFEKEFGWRGILAEPSRHWHKALADTRSAVIEHRCVWARSQECVSFGEPVNDQFRTQSAVVSESQAGNYLDSYEVETISLLDLLREHNAPTLVDFISIDVEGGEHSILEAFDFSQYRFEFLAIETMAPNNEIEALMERNGYGRILSTVSGHDSFFVPLETKRRLPTILCR